MNTKKDLATESAFLKDECKKMINSPEFQRGLRREDLRIWDDIFGKRYWLPPI